MGEFVVGIDDPQSAEVQALLAVHLSFANRHSPPEDVHALDITGLLADNVSFFSIRQDGELLGVGALKQLSEFHAELKSMHTAARVRGRGVGRAMVDHLVGVARARGCVRVSLETGSMAAFAPARALYASAGFEACEPFAEYRPSPNSVCMILELGQRGRSNASPDRIHWPDRILLTGPLFRIPTDGPWQPPRASNARSGPCRSPRLGSSSAL